MLIPGAGNVNKFGDNLLILMNIFFLSDLQLNPERCSLVLTTVKSDLATHFFNQIFTNMKTKASTTISTCIGSIRLRKFFKYFFVEVVWYT